MPVSKETTGGSLPLFFFFKLNLFGLDDFFYVREAKSDRIWRAVGSTSSTLALLSIRVT